MACAYRLLVWVTEHLKRFAGWEANPVAVGPRPALETLSIIDLKADTTGLIRAYLDLEPKGIDPRRDGI
jgi:hypothetical protein